MNTLDLKYVAVTVFALVLGSIIAVAVSVRAISHLDGMRTGRTTLVLSAAVQPGRELPVASWSAADRARVDVGFTAAMREAKESVEALEWVETYARLLKLPEREAAAKALRCTLEKAESVWLSGPRKLTRIVLNAPARVSKC